MADNLDDGEFWLPPQFLSDDDGDDSTTAPFSPKRKPSFLNNGEDSLFFPSEFPYGFACSDLSSPIDSLAASSETESDEDEQIFAELTRRMERSSLQLDSKPSENHNNNLGRFVTGSPQSTLCAFGSDCKCRKGSNQGSPNAVCEVSSSSSRATLDLLHAAAGEVEMLRLNQESVNINNNDPIVPSRKSSPVTLPSQNNSVSTNLDLGFFPQPLFSQQQFQFAQLQTMRLQQMAKNHRTMYGVGGVQKQSGGVFQQIQPNQVTPNGVDGGNNNAALGLSSSAWPTLQHAKQQQIPSPHYGGAMIPLIFGNGFVRRESSGTGVFLPRPVESRRKPATALVPARVAQALNLNLEDYIVGCQQQKHLHRSNSTSNVENVAAPPKHRGKNVHSQQRRSRNNNISRPEPAAAAVSNEIGLPQEWTY